MSSCGSCSPCEKPFFNADKASSRGGRSASRIASSTNVSSIASFPEYDLDSTLPVSEIKKNLSNLIKSKGTDLIKACKNYDKTSTNKVSKTQLRQVLRMFCFAISAAQFDSLCREINLNTSEKIDYYEFFKSISGLKSIEVDRSYERIPDNFPIDEVELRIKDKITPNLCNVIRTFWLFDLNKDGLIQKKDLRRVIRNYCFDLSDDLYNELWKRYDPKGTGAISYKKFLIKLGVSSERYKKYMPPHMAAKSLSGIDPKSQHFVIDLNTEQKSRRAAIENRDDPLIQGLPLDEIITIFLDRLQKRYVLLKNTLKLFDYEKNGLISVADFHAIMNYFVVATSATLFHQILERLRVEIPPTNKLCIQDFLEKFCKPTAKSIMKRKNAEKRDCFPVIQHIKNNVLNPDARLRSVFTKNNKNEEWQITRQELKRAIEMGLAFTLTDEEFKELTTILDPGNTNIIDCKDFLALFDKNQTDESKEVETVDASFESENPPSENLPSEKFCDLKGDKLKSKLKHYLNKNIINVERALLVCDMDQSSRIMPDRLKAVLSVFCFCLNEDQFNEIIKDLRRYGDTINYNEFLKMYKKKPDEDIKKWISTVDKLVTFKSRCDPTLPMDEVEEIVRDTVRSKTKAILKDFKSLDMCNVGVAYKDDVRNILNKYAFRLNDKQFKKLWAKCPVNSFGQLIYEKFLEEFSQPFKRNTTKYKESPQGYSDVTKEPGHIKKDREKVSSPVPTKGSSPVPSGRSKEDSEGLSCDQRSYRSGSRPSSRAKNAKDIVYCNAPHLKEIFTAMEPAIVKNFRVIRHHLRRIDPKLTGMVEFSSFKPILSQCGINLTDEEVFHILEYFDGSLSGKINYRDFLRIFVWYA